MNNTSFSITIPKPCHEDWNKMTPDQKGAFCGSCQKSVYDFTGKSDEEVTAILLKAQGQKICGRFDQKQLERPIENNVPIYNLSHEMNPLRAFAMALFLVFGAMLFNCEESYGQKTGKIKITETPVIKEEHVQGQMIAYPEPTKITGDTVVSIPQNNHVMGGPRFIPTPVKKDTVKKVVPVKNRPIKEPNYPMMGDICIAPTKGEVQIVKHPEPIDTVKKVTPIKKDSVVKQEMIMGKVAFHTPVKPPVVEKVPVVKKDTVTGPDPKTKPEMMVMGMVAYRKPEVPVQKPIVKDTIVPLVKEVPKDTAAINIKGHVNIVPKTPVVIKDTTATVKIKPIIPEVTDAKALSLEIMPNPSNGKLNLRYTIKEKNMTVIELYNISGTKVKTFIASQQLYEGIYNSSFDISDLADGIYICEMRSGERAVSSKVILTK